MLITSRVHPGEVQSSFALEGLVEFLLSDSEEANEIRSKFIVYVVPMLNIDGVINGNQRTNLAGLDLNRVWSDPSPQLSPVIYALKQFARIISEEREIRVFCDIHGHFKPTGCFMYCNSFERGNESLSVTRQIDNARLRIIPYMLSQINPHFRFKDTIFNMESYKASSARQVFFTEFGITYSFTLENSFFKKMKLKENVYSPRKKKTQFKGHMSISSNNKVLLQQPDDA